MTSQSWPMVSLDGGKPHPATEADIEDREYRWRSVVEWLPSLRDFRANLISTAPPIGTEEEVSCLEILSPASHDGRIPPTYKPRTEFLTKDCRGCVGSVDNGAYLGYHEPACLGNTIEYFECNGRKLKLLQAVAELSGNVK